MKMKLGYQPRTAVFASAAVLTLGMLMAGCTPDYEDDANSPSATPPAGADSNRAANDSMRGGNDSMRSGNDDMMQNGNDDMREGDAYAENDESMDAATQDSQQPVQDTWITTKVLTALQGVDDLDNTDIAVETSNAVVTLSGHVETQAMIDAAVRAAKSVEGVKNVDTSMLKMGTDAQQ